MTETIKLYSQDYKELLLVTDKHETANQFLRDSGQDWLHIVIDYGTDWQQRWSGRIERLRDGGTEIRQDREYLTWPTIPS